MGLALGLGMAPLAAGNPSGTGIISKTFVIHHKELDDVVSLIRGDLSDESSILLRSRARTLTITDRPDNLERVEELITAFDVKPADITLRINLIRASRGQRGRAATRLPDGLPPSFRELTKWLQYELLGGASVKTSETEASTLVLGDEYRIRFAVDTVDERSKRVRLRDFVLERRVVRPQSGETWVSIFDTVVNLKSGTPYVFGATRGQNSRRALFLSVTALIVP